MCIVSQSFIHNAHAQQPKQSATFSAYEASSLSEKDINAHENDRNNRLNVW